jgi:hypothetical protein
MSRSTRSQVRKVFGRGLRYVLNVLEPPGPEECTTCLHFDRDGAREAFQGDGAFAQAMVHLTPIDQVRAAAIEAVPQPPGERPTDADGLEVWKQDRRAELDAAADAAEARFRAMAGRALHWDDFGRCNEGDGEATHRHYRCATYERRR